MYNGLGNVKECKTLIKHGKIIVNGEVITDVKYPVRFEDVIIYAGKGLKAQPFIYYMLNKPSGYVCANYDKNDPCVIDLIDEKECYCLGRLDRDTTGLLIITNDKSLSKKLLLPQNHINKRYLVTTKNKLTNDLINRFKEGIIIDQDVQCLPACLEIIDETHCYVTIDEGKYHQVKKMFLSCDNEVVNLKRVSFGEIELDNSLKLGEYRSLTNDEIEMLLE